jgi:hypothetical protein
MGVIPSPSPCLILSEDEGAEDRGPVFKFL